MRPEGVPPHIYFWDEHAPATLDIYEVTDGFLVELTVVTVYPTNTEQRFKIEPLTLNESYDKTCPLRPK